MTGMRRAIAVHLVLAVALLLAPLTPVALHEANGDAGEITEPVDQLRNEFGSLGARETAPAREPVSAEVLVTLKLRANASLPVRQGLDVQRTYSRQGATHVEEYVPLTAVRDLSTDPAVEAVRMQSAADPGGRVAPGVKWIGADDLHERGWTGENVTVGVIDAEFRVSDPELAGHVAAYRSFDGTGAPGHGTAVASVVADTAPDARLHLAAVGDATSAEEYRRAVRWLRASGADIIVDAGSYFGRHGDGTAPLSTVATNASGSAVVVTSAGNYGQRHWTGTRDGEGWVAFAPETEGNVLAGNEVTRGRIRASLRWTPVNATSANHSTANESTSGPADYDLYLFRRGLRGPSVVAKATGSAGGDSVYLDTTVPRGRYYLAVRGSNVSRPQELELFASRDLSEQVANGSITTPATAPGVLAVGAYDRDRGAVAPFSSRGPVGNGTGVDLVAPDAVAAPGTGAESGTSFAAPYVAGTAALLQSRYPDLSPAETRSLLVSSTRDIGPEGPDVASGQGRLDAAAAGTLAEERARYAAVSTGTDSGATTELAATENPFQPPAPTVALAARQDLAALANGTNASDRPAGAETDRPTGVTSGP